MGVCVCVHVCVCGGGVIDCVIVCLSCMFMHVCVYVLPCVGVFFSLHPDIMI